MDFLLNKVILNCLNTIELILVKQLWNDNDLYSSKKIHDKIYKYKSGRANKIKKLLNQIKSIIGNDKKTVKLILDKYQ